MFVCDGFLRDPALLEALRDKDIWRRVPAYNWWEGWWRAPPANPLEAAVQAIWQGQIDEQNVAGFEYWFNDLSAGATLKWHRDCDEAIRKRDGRYDCPQVGHIYYATVEDVDGGFLEVSDKASLIEVESSDLERIRPVENRLVIFNPSFWHRVTRLARGRRIAFLANLWTRKPHTFDRGNHVDADFAPVSWK